ncbi:MAG: hypothetical protein HC890_14955 [Chloroflexaceae bacterium]|nr:hypothetical protein [Chloroflexaceae bacterium]
MARKLSQIQQDLAAIAQEVTEIAKQLQELYQNYFDALSRSTQKQLILASYQICTQAYPEAFLTITVRQRQRLQEQLKTTGKQLRSQLLTLLTLKGKPPALVELSKEPLEESSPLPLAEAARAAARRRELVINLELPGESEPPVPPDPVDSETAVMAFETDNPEELLEWHQVLEMAMDDVLADLSRQANRYLQESQILPEQLSAKLLDMAMQSEERTNSTSRPPNLLNLMVETKDQENSERIAKIVAIRLRLSELEFSDPGLSAQHQQIRKTIDRVNQLRQQYQKRQREQAVAAAEAAWRATWFEGEV